MKLELDTELVKPTVLYAVGAPGCGKTTRLKPYAEEIGATYLNPDEIRKWVLDDEFNRTDDTLVWDILNSSVKLALKAGRHVIIDAKNSDPHYRAQDVDNYKTYGAKKIVALFFNRQLDECIVNNAKRERPVPEEDIKKVYQILQSTPPSMDEGFDEVVQPALT